MTQPHPDAAQPKLGTQYFRTPFVFVDTEAYRRQNFDWEGEALAGLLKLAKSGVLVLLTTYITKREVQRHLDLWVEDAVIAIHKQRRLLKLAGLNVEPVSDAPALKEKARAAFDTFLVAANAVDVPLAVDVQNLVDDHFANRPPFSHKKRSEFRDAMVCASLAAWCAKPDREAYVVSCDSDLKAYCATTQKLIHVERVADVLSRALASDALHKALMQAFGESDDVALALAEVVRDVPARTPGASRHFAPGPIKADGHVTSARIDEITDVSTLEIAGDKFICEVSFVSYITMKLDVEDVGHHDEGSEFFHITLDKREPFAAVLTVLYDAQHSKLLEVLDVEADIEPIELDEDDVKDAIY